MTFKHNKSTQAFMALPAVILLATGIMAFSVAMMSAVVSYADSVYRRELRIQARLNAASCLTVVSIRFAKDYFLQGRSITVPELGCAASITNTFNGSISVHVKATLEDVSATDEGSYVL